MKNIGKRLVYTPNFVFYGAAAIVSCFMAIGFWVIVHWIFATLYGG